MRGVGGRRIIPAYAGSTHTIIIVSPSGGDHPRIRGEHPLEIDSLSTEKGSSPHTRGAPVVHRLARLASGIIPAYAGSTTYMPEAGFPVTDHPRIRGEHRMLQPVTR